MNTPTIVCDVCYGKGGYYQFFHRVPLSQCAVCGKKCLGFVVYAKSEINRVSVPAPGEPLRGDSPRADHAPEHARAA